MKEIDNENATKAKATRDIVYTIYTNKYIEHDQRKPTTKLHILQVAIEFSRRREHEPLTSRRFVILIGLKMARQSRRQLVKIQSTLCEVACKPNSRGFKIAVVKI